MNQFAIQQNGLVACEGAKPPFFSSSSSSDQNIPVVCPKPRRVGQFVGVDPIRPITVVNFSHRMQLCDSGSGADALEMLLNQDCYGDDDLQWEDSQQMACSPPFFYGSPPSRSANPIVQDTRFLEDKANNTALTPLAFMSTSPSGGRRGGFLSNPTSFGQLPAAVRIEGFDCLDRDRRGCSIPAFA